MADPRRRYPTAGPNPITGVDGSFQYLGHLAAHHDGQSTVIPGVGNRIQARALPLAKAPVVGKPDAVNPLGRYFGESQGGGDAGGGE
jgi:hypothetical protein